MMSRPATDPDHPLRAAVIHHVDELQIKVQFVAGEGSRDDEEDERLPAYEPGDLEFDETLELDLASVAPSVAGPRRPQDRIVLSDLRDAFERDFPPPGGNGYGYPDVPVNAGGRNAAISTGSVAIAAITSCTNTSNPDVLIAAGLVAKKARELGLTRKPWVKTSLAPGSQVVSAYLEALGTRDPAPGGGSATALVAALAAALLLLGCEEDPVPGVFGAECYPNQTCNAGLRCEQGRCLHRPHPR